YDKAATILKLGYPGGPKLDALAQKGNDRAHDFPISSLGRDNLNFSYSGLKTSLLYAVCGQPVGRGADSHFERDGSQLSESERADFAASFQRAAIGAIMKNVTKALDRQNVKTMLIGGGVSANSRLRHELQALGVERSIDVRLPAMEYCLDNAAMIAGLGAVRYQAGLFDDLTLAASPRTTFA
ncbi:MAG: tRNA (adenosine(37)-N6)-threonylcarbamoyltransferase complex transferase subunit TsaD, partial [Planctomycetes bacterium]|nr:tRNA (adenosine(37)-N6)-threonylcarbamoyltransferase complex transferase subunit TsaD [Planctomycetota bacterium]